MLRTLLFLLMFPSLALAQSLPAPLGDTVSDFAEILSPDQEAALTARLQTARDDTGVHIVVVTMERRSDYGGGGKSIEAYGKALLNQWGIGDARRNDGILILVARGDREMRITLGAGYDAVYEGLAQRVINRDMLPAFKAGDYPGGIAQGVEGVIRDLATPFGAHSTPQPVASPEDKTPFLFLVGAIIVIGFGSLRERIGDLLARFRACPSCGERGLHRRRTIHNRATLTRTGDGELITSCRRCKHESRDSYVIPARGGNGSGGSSGFGGGRSSGGGASGRW